MWIFPEKAYQFRLCILRHKICGDAERWQWQWWPCTRVCRSGIGYWWNMFISEYSHSNDVQMKFAYGIGVYVCMCDANSHLFSGYGCLRHCTKYCSQCKWTEAAKVRGRENKKCSTATFKKWKWLKLWADLMLSFIYDFFFCSPSFFFSLILSFHTFRFDIKRYVFFSSFSFCRLFSPSLLNMCHRTAQKNAFLDYSQHFRTAAFAFW